MNTYDCTKEAAPTFTTERLPLAVFLHATDRLRFMECKPASHRGKVMFVFADPHFIGSQAELEFDRGAVVPATALFASQRFLRRRMSEALNNLTIGESDEHRYLS